MNGTHSGAPAPDQPGPGDAAATVELTADRVFVIVGSQSSRQAVHYAKALADRLQVPWDAIFPETSSANDERVLVRAGEDLALAASLGAAVYRLPSATVADAVLAHIAHSQAPHLVLEARARSICSRVRRPSLLEDLASRDRRIVFHSIAANGQQASAPAAKWAPSSGRDMAIAAGAVLLTLAVALVISAVTRDKYLSILFLFPVIAVAARLGLIPSLLAAVLSTLSFNFAFLNPIAAFDPWVAQSWLMLAVLVGVAIYTAALTSALRGRITLSDRSAQESASLAAFAQKLTRVADWQSTAKAVCDEVGLILDVRSLLVREIDGGLVIVSSNPEGAQLDPLDKTALDWAWQHGTATGSGSDILSDASWQFQPLKTSLGVLAILGIAREDGRNPIPSERAVLFATIVAQAALAHERLRLEEQMNAPQRPS